MIGINQQQLNMETQAIPLQEALQHQEQCKDVTSPPQKGHNPNDKNFVSLIKGPQPDIKLESLPRSLAKTIEGLKSEISLGEALFISTEADLLELDHLFRDINLSDIILRFSFILSYVNTCKKYLSNDLGSRYDEIMAKTLQFLVENLKAPSSQTDGSSEKQSIRNVKWKSLCDELKRAGFQLLRTKGGHRPYQHPEAKEIGLAAVPTSNKTKTVSTGVVRDVRKKI